MLGARITAWALGVLNLCGEKGGENMYVLRFFRGAVCFQKFTFYDRDLALGYFGSEPDFYYSFVSLEMIEKTSSQMWIRTAPYVTKKGGEKND